MMQRDMKWQTHSVSQPQTEAKTPTQREPFSLDLSPDSMSVEKRNKIEEMRVQIFSPLDWSTSEECRSRSKSLTQIVSLACSFILA